ncbi:MAG TPA: hypothetical protein VFU15_01495 [Bacteroidia bacterium]|nr:hypothetical protein [Bacteroidia bacterium]
MENVYRKFYRACYMHTGGYIPAKPLNEPIYPGDFFQLRNGEMILLGNIFRAGVIDPGNAQLSSGVRLNGPLWNFSEDITKPYAGRGHGHGPVEGEFEFSRQIIGFSSRGSFFFRGNEPESTRIANWNELQQAVIIRMTQTMFSFRQLYVVVDTASLADWTLAISGSSKGELEIATDRENFNLLDLFGNSSSRTVQSKEIDYYHREAQRKPSFFRAKKLVVQDEKIETFISDYIGRMTSRYEWANAFFEYDFQHDSSYSTITSQNTSATMLDMLQANELNPNTALLYFKWADANLDDIEKMFVQDGD